jgi:hypothetical protein
MKTMLKMNKKSCSHWSGEKGTKALKKVFYEIEILPQVYFGDSSTKLFMVTLIRDSIICIFLSSTNAVACLYIVKHNIHLANSEGFWTSDFHIPFDVVISLAFVIIFLQWKSDL